MVHNVKTPRRVPPLPNSYKRSLGRRKRASILTLTITHAEANLKAFGLFPALNIFLRIAGLN